jgi:hypothetical protein
MAMAHYASLKLSDLKSQRIEAAQEAGSLVCKQRARSSRGRTLILTQSSESTTEVQRAPNAHLTRLQGSESTQSRSAVECSSRC